MTTKRYRSRITVEGLDRTPHRAFLRGMGLSDAAIAKPFIGVVSTEGRDHAVLMTLGVQADAAKVGVVGGRRHAARVHDHLRLRRHVDEPSRACASA